MAHAVAGAVDYEERFLRVRERHQQRMIAPYALVVQPHAELLLAFRRRDRPVGVNDAALAELARLFLPQPHPNPIDRVHERDHVKRREAPQEVSGRRGVGDARGPEQVHVGLVLAQEFQVLELRAAGHDVVRDVHHVVGLAAQRPAFGW